MPEAARLNDSVAGTTRRGAHRPRPSAQPGDVWWSDKRGLLGNVFINGRPGGYRRERHNGDGRLLPGAPRVRWPPGADPSTSTGNQPPGLETPWPAHSGAGAVASGSSDVFIGG